MISTITPELSLFYFIKTINACRGGPGLKSRLRQNSYFYTLSSLSTKSQKCKKPSCLPKLVRITLRYHKYLIFLWFIYFDIFSCAKFTRTSSSPCPGDPMTCMASLQVKLVPIWLTENAPQRPAKWTLRCQNLRSISLCQVGLAPKMKATFKSGQDNPLKPDVFMPSCFRCHTHR